MSAQIDISPDYSNRVLSFHAPQHRKCHRMENQLCLTPLITFFSVWPQERIKRCYSTAYAIVVLIQASYLQLVFILRRTKIHFRGSAIELRASNFFTTVSFDPDLLPNFASLPVIHSVLLNVTSRVKTVAIFWTTFYHRTNYHFLVLETRDAPESLGGCCMLQFWKMRFKGPPTRLNGLCS